MLKLKYNVDSLEDGSTQGSSSELNEIFEQRMEIEEADTEEELFAIQMQIQTQYDDEIKEMGECFERHEFDAVKKHLERTKYLD